MKFAKVIAAAAVTAVAVSSMAVAASAEPVQPGIFVIGFGDAGILDSFASSYEQTAQYNGDGTYTVSLDLSGGYTNDEWIDEETGDLLELTTGNSIGAMGVQIYGEEYEGLAVDIKSVKFDGTELPLTGVSYTNDEDGGRRTNIYNAWAGYDPSKEDHITKDPAAATSTLIDISELGEWSTVEVTFEVYGGAAEEAAPAETEAAPAETEAAPAETEAQVDAAPAETAAPVVSAGDTNQAAASGKGSPDTGIADVAAAAGLAIVAGGAFVMLRKRK